MDWCDVSSIRTFSSHEPLLYETDHQEDTYPITSMITCSNLGLASLHRQNIASLSLLYQYSFVPPFLALTDKTRHATPIAVNLRQSYRVHLMRCKFHFFSRIAVV